MKPGDLCKLVGTVGWGEVCLVVRTNANGVGALEVLLQTGRTAIIGQIFLQVISEAG